ncbi:hypothetical protein GQ42DRAFT_163780, partial [Ramicandelaber brevisporus]
MRSCVCVSSAVVVWPVLSLPSSNLCLPLYPLLPQDPLKHGVFSLSLVSLFLCVFVSASMSIRVFPAACSICSPLSWFVPSSVGFLPRLSLAVVGRWLSSS